MADETHDLYVERASKDAFAPTLARLEQAVEQAGMMVFARIDHADAARRVGMTMPPTTVLLYGNPRGGTPAMMASPRVALDLPLRVLVREDPDGQVLVGFHPIRRVLLEAGVPDDLASRLEAANGEVLKAFKA